MNGFERILSIGLLCVPLVLCSQERRDLPPVTTTFKGSLNLPAPLKNPLFQGFTETIGQLDGVIQFPVYRGWSLGVGGKMTWFGLKERVQAIAPLASGDIRRGSLYGKIAYEEYTSKRTFFELSGRAGQSFFAFDCASCPAERQQVFHFGAAASYYIHVSDNLAFGFTLGYERDAKRFGAMDLGLDNFTGIRETAEDRNFQNMIIGMGFSTRFTRSPDGPEW